MHRRVRNGCIFSVDLENDGLAEPRGGKNKGVKEESSPISGFSPSFLGGLG